MRLPLLYYTNNVGGTATLLEAMLSARCQNIVFSSSCATYGIPQSNPIPESHGQAPIHPYGTSKHLCEQMIKRSERAHGLRSMILRYFNAAGADPDGEIGENHNPETHLIPLVLRAAQHGTSVKVFGTDYPTVDGTCVRDYVHVSDLATAHVLALRRLLSGAPSRDYNLGLGRGHTVREVVDTAKEVTGRTIAVEEMPRRSGDSCTAGRRSGIGAARALLGVPRWAAVADQVAHAWHWVRCDRRPRRPAA